jgi:hypothetical protein
MEANFDLTGELESNPYLRDKHNALELIIKLTAQPQPRDDDECYRLMNGLRRLIEEDFKAYAARDDFRNEGEVYRDLLTALDRLQEVADFPDIRKRRVVAVGGAFSSGKSEFVNTILGINLLPVNLSRSTAIPTFIVQADDERIIAQNLFGAEISLDFDALQALCHRFADAHNIILRQLVKHLFIRLSNHAYSGLAIVDTPGYNSASIGTDEQWTDQEIALGQLRKADHIMWVIDIEKGAVHSTDIEMLKGVGKPGQVTIIFNKAEMKPPGEREAIIARAREQLKESGIEATGIFLFSSYNPVVADRDPIERILNELNCKRSHAEYDVPFLKAFDRLRGHYSKQLKLCTETRNKIQTLRMLDVVRSRSARELFDDLKAEYTRRIDHTRELADNLGRLRARLHELLVGLERCLGIVLVSRPEIKTSSTTTNHRMLIAALHKVKQRRNRMTPDQVRAEMCETLPEFDGLSRQQALEAILDVIPIRGAISRDELRRNWVKRMGFNNARKASFKVTVKSFLRSLEKEEWIKVTSTGNVRLLDPRTSLDEYTDDELVEIFLHVDKFRKSALSKDEYLRAALSQIGKKRFASEIKDRLEQAFDLAQTMHNIKPL